MKKLKIFLLLSILLCFGFVLSPDVHAQGTGPKPFEVGDVLPATTQLRISWTVDETTLDLYYSTYGEWYVRTTASPQYFLIDAPSEGTSTYVTIAGVKICEFDNDNNTFVGWKTPYTAPSGDHAYIDIDTSSWSLEKRTVTKTYDMHGEPSWFLWEDLNAPTEPSNAKPFEVGDVLPATTKLRISWDNLINSYLVSGGGYYRITAKSEFIIATCGEDVNGIISLSFYIFDEPYHQYGMNVFTLGGGNYGWVDPYTAYGGGHNYIVVDTSMWSLDRRTIMNVSIDGLYWEDLNAPPGNGPGNGNGNGSPGASDFYANFDKYFIPAMIIVFGGAIVLTILKVFKGRE